jgi:N-acetylmuramoyl-L-alanine amidase
LTPQVIVLHWTAGPTAASAWNTFAAPRLAGRPELLRGGELNVGAHYVVDRDGSIERLFTEDRVVRHCIGLNHVAVGIENVGGGPGLPLTPAQVDADAALIRDIASRQPIRWLYGHLESAAIEANPLYEERDPAYRNSKPDPGAEFMVKVRAKVEALGLGP